MAGVGATANPTMGFNDGGSVACNTAAGLVHAGVGGRMGVRYHPRKAVPVQGRAGGGSNSTGGGGGVVVNGNPRSGYMANMSMQWQHMVPLVRVPNVGGADGASPYKRHRPQSPGAVPQRPGAYPYPQDQPRYSIPVPTSYAFHRDQYQCDRGDYHRREIERRRPSLLGDYQNHALERERHAQEQPYQYTFDREAASQYMSRVTTASQPTTSPQQPPQQPTADMIPHSYKRPRLGEPRPELTQPLRIDTTNPEIKREPVYNPQVEAISPTLPTEDKAELSSVQSSKDELLQSINRVDREIGKVENHISKLKKKQDQIAAESAKPAEAKSVTTDVLPAEPKHQSIAQIVYAENRKKAVSAHNVLSKLGPKVDLPLYNQPSDTAVYHENKRKYLAFKKRLLMHFKKKHHSKHIRERYLTERYDQLMQTWLKKIERIENNAKRRAKDAKTREFFEKVFPELKKQREDRERIQRPEASTHHSRVGSANRVSGYARSEAELEQIMDGLHEQEEEEKKMRSYAVVPPMLLDARERSLCFHNNNGLIEDPMTEYKERQVFNVWTDTEKDNFKERFLQHPKNFSYIASFLDRKTVQDCVQYYYLTKKNENYKQLLRKQSVKKRKFPKQPHQMRTGAPDEKDEKPDPSDPGMVPIIPTQADRKGLEDREREREQERERSVSAPGPAPSLSSTVTTTTSTGATAAATTTTTPTTAAAAISAITTAATTTITTLPPCQVQPTGDTPSQSTDVEVKVEPMDEMANIPNDVGDQVVGVHQCAVCKSQLEHYGRSRPLTKSNCVNYGLREEALTEDMRVCSSCRCRSVRRRYTHCPVLMCKTPKRKVKRLRPLPAKWAELPSELKDPVIRELQLTDEITKCCSACFNRIARRLGNNPQTNEPLVALVPENADEIVETPRWTEEEMEIAKQGLREHGRDWAAISASVATKSEAQCKNFYFNYKRKFSLEQLVEEFRRNKLSAKGESDGRTVSTSESVTSTITAPSEEDLSSSDDDNVEDNDESSDTASAPSPLPRSDERHDSTTKDAPEVEELRKEEKVVVSEETKVPSHVGLTQESLAASNRTLSTSQGSLRSITDYDSSATLSADEGPPLSSSHTNELRIHAQEVHVIAPEGDDHKMDVVTSSSAVGGMYGNNSGCYASSGGHPKGQHSHGLPSSGITLGHSGGGSITAGTAHHRRLQPDGERDRDNKIMSGSLSGNVLVNNRPEKRSSPACVRDLIDCAIERNLAQDLSQKKLSAPDLHPSALLGPLGLSRDYAGPQSHPQPHPSHPKDLRKDLRREGPPDPAALHQMVQDSGPPPRHAGSPYPAQSQHGHPTHMTRERDDRDTEAQDLSRRTMSPQVHDRSPHTYMCKPRDYDPRNPLYHEMYRRSAAGIQETQGMAPIRAPPPAHSHHPQPMSQRHQAPQPDGLHHLATVATEREPQRVHSESRDKSPSGYHPERSQVTPPALRQTTSPYSMAAAMDRHNQHGGQRPMMGRNPIGQPPPLINIKQQQQPPPKMTIKTEKMSPIVQSQHPSGPTRGSITQGTPVQQPSSSQPQTTRCEGSISLGTPRYDPQIHRSGTPQPQRVEGSISMGTPRYESGAGRGTPPMHDQGVGRLPTMYEQALGRGSPMLYEQGMRMIYEQTMDRMYPLVRRLSPTGATGYYPPGVPYPGPHPGGHYTSDQYSSSRATLMDDFVTAQHMQRHRAADKDRQASPRNRESLPPREATQAKPFPMEHGMPPPPMGHFGPLYIHPGAVPTSGAPTSSQDRVSGQAASPMQSRDATPPRIDTSAASTAAWLQGHPGVRPSAQSQQSPGGQQMGGHPGDHRHPTPPPRGNVIQRSITHGTVIIEPALASPRGPDGGPPGHYPPGSQSSAHLNGNSPLTTLVDVAVNAGPLPTKPSMRDPAKAAQLAMAEQEREKERMDRDTAVAARELAVQRDRMRVVEAERRIMEQQEHQMMMHRFKMDQDRKEMEARQAQAVAVAERQERERKEREMERERERERDPRRPESREGYHSKPPNAGGQMRPLERPPDARPHSNHMQEVGPQYSFPFMNMPPRSESGPSGGHRPPSTDMKPGDSLERRQEQSYHASFKDSGSKGGGGDPGNGAGGGSSGGGRGGNGESRTLTAATLIDAIIIHQINNGANSMDEKKTYAPHGQPHHHHPGAGSQGDGPNSMAAPHVTQPPKQLPQSGQLPQHQPPYPSVHHPHHQPHPHHSIRPDTTKGRPEQKSPPYKPHKTINRYEADLAAAYRSEQQLLQREPPSSLPNHQGGPLSSADVERSQGGSPSSDRSNKSTASAQSSSSSRAITLGEHIDAIIIQDYTRKGHGGSPNGSCQAEQTNMTVAELNTCNAIKSFLANSGTSSGSASDGSTESPSARITSSPSQGGATSMMPDSSQREVDVRPRSMSVGNHHKHAMPSAYRPTLQQIGMSDVLMGRVDMGQVSNGPHSSAPCGQQSHSVSMSTASALTHATSSSVYAPAHSSGHPTTQPVTPAQSPGLGPREIQDGPDRPRSYSAGAHKMTSSVHNWKLKRALEQQEKEQHMAGIHQGSQAVGAAQSPMVLAPDEREIVKIARMEHSGGSESSVSQSGQQDQRSPQVPGYNVEPISPTSNSTDSGGPESTMKTSPPRSPRMSSHQGAPHGLMGHAAMTVGQQKQQQAAVAAAMAAGHPPISSLAASHQAITSLLSRPQSKQTTYPADSSAMSQHGGENGGRPYSRPGRSSYDYVQDKIAEVMQTQDSPRPSSSSGSPAESGWDKRTLLHPLDASRYGVRGGVESSSHRDWAAGDRYMGGRSPIRDDTVSGSKQRSPRPSIHSQSSEESQGSMVSSADDVHNATSTTMKPPPMGGGVVPQQGPPAGMMGRDYRDRLVHSPMITEGYARSPRPYPDSRMPVAMAESSSNVRSPKFSPVGTSDMVVSGSCGDDMRSNHEVHAADSRTQGHRPGSHSQRVMADDGRSNVHSDSSNVHSAESPQSDRMIIDEGGGADSSAHVERYSPATEGGQHGSISTSQHSSVSSKQDSYGDVDSQTGKVPRGVHHPGGDPAIGRSPHHSLDAAPAPSSSSSLSNPSSNHVDSSRFSNPHYAQPDPSGGGGRGHLSHNPQESGVSTSSTGQPPTQYGPRYLYPVLPGQHPHAAPLVQRSSPAPSPAPLINREAEPSPLLSAQYETLSDDDN